MTVELIGFVNNKLETLKVCESMQYAEEVALTLLTDTCTSVAIKIDNEYLGDYQLDNGKVEFILAN